MHSVEFGDACAWHWGWKCRSLDSLMEGLIKEDLGNRGETRFGVKGYSRRATLYLEFDYSSQQ